MNTTRTISILVVLTAMLTTTGCKSNNNTKTNGQLVPFTSVSDVNPTNETITDIAVDNRVGKVTIEASADTQVHINADVRLRENRVDTTDKGTFKDHVVTTQETDTFRIADAHSGQPDEQDWAITFTISVPVGKTIRVKNGVGDVTIDCTTAELDLKTGVGKIIMDSDQTGPITASTGTGDVILDVDTIKGAVEAKCGVGQVIMTTHNINDTIVATSGTGDVSLNMNKVTPTHDITLTTNVGDVILQIPSGSGGRYQFSTNVGKIHMNNQSDVQLQASGVGAKVDTTLASAGPTYRLTTGTGNIRLK